MQIVYFPFQVGRNGVEDHDDNDKTITEILNTVNSGLHIYVSQCPINKGKKSNNQ